MGALKGEMKEGKYNNPPEDLSNFTAETWVLTKMKKAVIMVLGSAAMKYMKKLANEQELMLNLSDMLMCTYAVESTLLRTQKLIKMRGADKCKDQIAMTQLFMYEHVGKLRHHGEEAILAFTEGKEQVKLLAGLGILTRGYYPNTKALRRQIAATLIEANKYCY